MNWAYRKNIDN